MPRKKKAAGRVQPPNRCVALKSATPRASKCGITSSSLPSFSWPSLLSSPWYGSCVDGLKTHEKLIRPKMYHGLGQNTPKGCGIHKRLGSGPLASGLRVVGRAEELSAPRVNL